MRVNNVILPTLRFFANFVLLIKQNDTIAETIFHLYHLPVEAIKSAKMLFVCYFAILIVLITKYLSLKIFTWDFKVTGVILDELLKFNFYKAIQLNN